MQTLEGHAHNVSAVMFHPELPVILTGSEDGSVRMWHSTTYRLENTLNYGMERVWALACTKGSNSCAPTLAALSLLAPAIPSQPAAFTLIILALKHVELDLLLGRTDAVFGCCDTCIPSVLQ